MTYRYKSYTKMYIFVFLYTFVFASIYECFVFVQD